MTDKTALLALRKIADYDPVGGDEYLTALALVQKWAREALAEQPAGTPQPDGGDREAAVELAKLVEFFRGEGYQRFGWEGDVSNWSPADTAIKAMRSLLRAATPAMRITLVDRGGGALAIRHWHNDADLPAGDYLLYTTTQPPAGDIYEAYKTWPADIRKKLSLHDLRRMSGWAPRTVFDDWTINTQAGGPILTYRGCSVIEGEDARYVLGLIEKDATPQPDGGDGAVLDAELDDLVLQYGNARAHGLMDKAAEIYTQISCRTRPSAAAAVDDAMVERALDSWFGIRDIWAGGERAAGNRADMRAALTAALATPRAEQGDEAGSG